MSSLLFPVSVEVLVEIFCIVAKDPTFSWDIIRLGPLLNVCLTWRRIIMEFANFWRDLDVFIYDRQVEDLEFWTENLPSWFGTLGVLADTRDIEISPKDTHAFWILPYDRCMTTIPFLLGVIPHAHELHIHCKRPCFETLFPAPLMLNDNIRSLRLYNRCSHDHSMEERQFQYNLPRLVSLDLQNINCIVQATNITHLTLKSISLQTTLTILSNSPKVTFLHLHEIHNISNTSTTFPTLSMQYVQTFEVMAVEAGLDVLRHLHLPQVNELELEVANQSVDVQDVVTMLGDRLWPGDIYIKNGERGDFPELEWTLTRATFTYHTEWR
jgi:hypothetical protein